MSSPAFLLSLLILPVACEGQVAMIDLTGSASSAVTGHPFTFTCDMRLFWLLRPPTVTWTRELKTGTRECQVACNAYNGSKRSCMSTIYNCSSSTYTLTIPNVDFDTYQNSNWTCEVRDIRSNSISLDVNVPLKRVTLLNSTQRVKRVGDGETVTFVCETNPTKPPSTITWTIGEDVVTGGVTSRSRDSKGFTATVSSLTRTVTPELHLKRIRCEGYYPAMKLNFSSKLLQLAVEGDMERSTGKLVVVTEPSVRGTERSPGKLVMTETEVRGLTFGAGVGVGMTVCLVPFLVAVAVFIAFRRRQTVSAAENKQRTDATINTTFTAVPPSGAQQHNLYEGIDDATRERSGNTSYEELRIYQNTNQSVA